MKITELDLKENGKKYFCNEINEVFEVEEGNLIAATRSFSMAELLEMDFEEIKEMKNPYKRVDNRERYYFVSERGGVDHFKDLDHGFDNKQFNSSNYFNNKNYAEYVGFKETLMRKLDRFAWEHNAKVINWGDCSQPKHYIVLNNSRDKNLEVYSCFALQSNNIYFTSKEIAEKAIEEFKDDLMKLYTWEFDF